MNFGQPESHNAVAVSASRIRGFENDNREYTYRLGNFAVLEHMADLSLRPSSAMPAYFMSEMGVHLRQLVIELDGCSGVNLQAGAMQWMLGDIDVDHGVKGVGDLVSKVIRGKATGESAIKPEYRGTGLVVLEPTYKHIILEKVADWGDSGMVVEDGMFLACSDTVRHFTKPRSNVSSAVAGGEGLFNLCLSGRGIVALESRVPRDELIVIDLADGDVLKIDGSMAVAWSGSLSFTVEPTTRSLIGSAASGEGLVNVYRGTGRVMMSPVASSLVVS